MDENYKIKQAFKHGLGISNLIPFNQHNSKLLAYKRGGFKGIAIDFPELMH